MALYHYRPHQNAPVSTKFEASLSFEAIGVLAFLESGGVREIDTSAEPFCNVTAATWKHLEDARFVTAGSLLAEEHLAKAAEQWVREHGTWLYGKAEFSSVSNPFLHLAERAWADACRDVEPF